MASKDHAGTHAENRLKICLICKGKPKSLHKLQPAVIGILENYTNYDFNDQRLPGAICVNCKFKIKKAEKANDNETLSRILPDYSELQLLRTLRSNSKKCICAICDLARKKTN